MRKGSRSWWVPSLLKSRTSEHHAEEEWDQARVLNAKYHEKEAEIVAQAGKKGTVTIATNMAGRGTDIVLGGNAEFLNKETLRKKGINPDLATREEWNDGIHPDSGGGACRNGKRSFSAGGLHILGTERHESRRIDNQLRGRAGRQGDPGTSRFTFPWKMI